MRERVKAQSPLLLLNDNVTLAYEAIRHGLNKLIPACAIANISITTMANNGYHLSVMIRGACPIIEADFELSGSPDKRWHHRVTFVYKNTRHCIYFAPSAAKGREHLFFEVYDEQTPAA